MITKNWPHHFKSEKSVRKLVTKKDNKDSLSTLFEIKTECEKSHKKIKKGTIVLTRLRIGQSIYS